MLYLKFYSCDLHASGVHYVHYASSLHSLHGLHKPCIILQILHYEQSSHFPNTSNVTIHNRTHAFGSFMPSHVKVADHSSSWPPPSLAQGWWVISLICISKFSEQSSVLHTVHYTALIIWTHTHHNHPIIPISSSFIVSLNSQACFLSSLRSWYGVWVSGFSPLIPWLEKSVSPRTPVVFTAETIFPKYLAGECPKPLPRFTKKFLA